MSEKGDLLLKLRSSGLYGGRLCFAQLFHGLVFLKINAYSVMGFRRPPSGLRLLQYKAWATCIDRCALRFAQFFHGFVFFVMKAYSVVGFQRPPLGYWSVRPPA